MAPRDRKSVEPMASHLAPGATRSRHPSLHHFVADSAWSDDQMLLRVAQWVVPAMDFSDGGWCIAEDTGFPKQGTHAVGVVRQYCGMLGKQHSCQVVVSVTMACHAVSLPVAWQLYLPREWVDDGPRCGKAGVPKESTFATKPAIALAQIERLLDQGAPKHCLLADAGYGVATALQERLSELGLVCAVGVTGQVTVWPSGHAPLPPLAYSARGSPAHAEPCPIVHAELAAGYRRSLAPNATKVRMLPARKRQASLVTQQDDGPVRPGVGAGPVQTRQPCDQRSLRAQPQFSSGSPSRL